jgi:molybdate transport system substrate-binding protein
VVSAASSLRDALAELAPMAEARLGARLVLNFGSSGDLARQILAADGPDLFLSADEVEMERLAAAGRIEPASRRVLCANELVVIEPADEGPSPFQGPFEPSQLADVPLLSLADPLTVPAGRYARAWLEARGAWAAVAERVVPAIDARAALAAVESGALRAGIVYRTDAARSSRVRVVFRVPRAEGPRIRYPVAVVAGSPEAERARALAEFLVTEEARALLARHGFVPLGDGE